MYCETTQHDKVNIMELERKDALVIRDLLKQATMVEGLTTEERQRLSILANMINAECMGLATGYYDSKMNK